jgi:diacylglycerol kinase family enzyme
LALQSGNPASRQRRPRRTKPDAEIVLVCNPRAGGRWKELAKILDAEEATYTRRIVTDSVEDIGSALEDVGRDAKLVCIYGGDGTIQRVLDRLTPGKEQNVHLALLGGGTMNVTSRWCGFSKNPAKNFRYIVRAFRSGDLLLREVPLLEVRAGDESHRGFTFGIGPIVRLLDAYERGQKGKSQAVWMGAKAISAIWTKRPAVVGELLQEMVAEIELDGEVLPYSAFSAVFANVTGQINPGVEPFAEARARDKFLCAAYAVSPREVTVVLPFLMRGWLPVDVGAMLKRAPEWSTDPRYVNRQASRLRVKTEEPIYTVDGEILRNFSGELSVELGPLLKLATGPGAVLRMAADAVRPR